MSYIIEDTDVETSVIDDPGQALAIEEFIETVKRDNSVTLGQVLTLESFLGNSVITSKVPENGIPLESSAIAVDSVLSALTTIERKVPVEEVYTRDMVLERVVRLSMHVDKLDYVYSSINSINFDAVSSLANLNNLQDQRWYDGDEFDKLMNPMNMDLKDVMLNSHLHGQIASEITEGTRPILEHTNNTLLTMLVKGKGTVHAAASFTMGVNYKMLLEYLTKPKALDDAKILKRDIIDYCSEVKANWWDYSSNDNKQDCKRLDFWIAALEDPALEITLTVLNKIASGRITISPSKGTES